MKTKALTALIVASLLGAIAPLVAAARPATPARVDAALAAQLAAAGGAGRVAVLVHATSRRAALDAIDATGLETVLVLESIGVPVAVGPAAAVRALAGEPGVTYVEADRPLQFFSDTAAVATRVTAARGARPGSPVLRADGKPFTGAGRTIAIVDSGIDGTHPMFTRADGSSKVVRNLKVACVERIAQLVLEDGTEIPPNGCTFTGDPDAFVVDMTDQGNNTDTISLGGHGTHVASIAAGYQRSTAAGQKVSGTAPGAALLGLSVGTAASVLSSDVALDWIARHGKDPCGDHTCPPITVVNNSYGAVGGGEFDPESATTKITAKLVANGVVMVWANGNDGGDGTENFSNPSAQDPLPGVIGVANYDDQDSGKRDLGLAPSSSRGDVTRRETWPDVSAPGTSIKAACRYTLVICRLDGDVGDPDYANLGGTSMAAPHVAGVVALLQEANPRITPAQVESTLENTAYRFAGGGTYAPDPRNPSSPSSFDKGHGLVDAHAALQAVRTGTVTQSAAPCAGLTGTDATGEVQKAGVTVADAPYDPSLDLTAVSLTAATKAETVTLVLKVVDLTDAPPSASNGSWFSSTFAAPGGAHEILVQRDPTGVLAPVLIDGEQPDGVEAVGNVDTDTITVTAGRKLFEPDLAGTIPIGGVTVQSGRILGAVILFADDAGTGCGTLAVGGTALAGVPTVTVGKPYTWKGEPTTSVDDPTGSDLIDVTPTGTHEDTRTLNVRVPAKGRITVHVLASDPELNDYDLTVFGPDGKPTGFGSDDPAAKDGTSAAEGGDETVTIPSAASGVYRIVVEAFATVDATYTGTVTVS